MDFFPFPLNITAWIQLLERNFNILLGNILRSESNEIEDFSEWSENLMVNGKREPDERDFSISNKAIKETILVRIFYFIETSKHIWNELQNKFQLNEMPITFMELNNVKTISTYEEFHIVINNKILDPSKLVSLLMLYKGSKNICHELLHIFSDLESLDMEDRIDVFEKRKNMKSNFKVPKKNDLAHKTFLEEALTKCKFFLKNDEIFEIIKNSNRMKEKKIEEFFTYSLCDGFIGHGLRGERRYVRRELIEKVINHKYLNNVLKKKVLVETKKLFELYNGVFCQSNHPIIQAICDEYKGICQDIAEHLNINDDMKGSADGIIFKKFQKRSKKNLKNLPKIPKIPKILKNPKNPNPKNQKSQYIKS